MRYICNLLLMMKSDALPILYLCFLSRVMLHGKLKGTLGNIWKFQICMLACQFVKGAVPAQEPSEESPKDSPKGDELQGLYQTCCYWFTFRILLEAVQQVLH